MICPDVDAEDDKGLTPLHEAASIDILKYLIEKGAKNYSKCLLEEIRTNFIKYFIEIGADIEVRNSQEQTPLIYAAAAYRYKHFSCVTNNHNWLN